MSITVPDSSLCYLANSDLDRLRHLSNVLELVEGIDDDRQTLGPSAVHATQSHSEDCRCYHCSSLCSTLNYAFQEFAQHLSQLYAKLDTLDLRDADRSLVRVLRLIEAFRETAGNHIPQDDDSLKEINNIHHSVTHKLLLIALKEEDHAEAGRLRRILAKHDPRMASSLSASLSETSKRMRSTFDTLRLPSMVRQAFNISTAIDLYPPLHLALKYRMTAAICKLGDTELESLWEKDPFKRNAIHVAAAKSNAKFLAKIDLSNQDKAQLLKDQDVFGDTPLMLAAYHGDVNTFQALWDTGVGLDLRDGRGRSIMVIACFAGSLEIVKFLLGRRVSQHDHNVFSRQGPLYVAAARNKFEICKILLEHNFSGGQFTPLEMKEAVHVATENGNTRIVKLLCGSNTHTSHTTQRSSDATQPVQFSASNGGEISTFQEQSFNPQNQCPVPPPGPYVSIPNFLLDNSSFPNFPQAASEAPIGPDGGSPMHFDEDPYWESI